MSQLGVHEALSHIPAGWCWWWGVSEYCGVKILRLPPVLSPVLLRLAWLRGAFRPGDSPTWQQEPNCSHAGPLALPVPVGDGSGDRVTLTGSTALMARHCPHLAQGLSLPEGSAGLVGVPQDCSNHVCPSALTGHRAGHQSAPPNTPTDLGKGQLLVRPVLC